MRIRSVFLLGLSLVAVPGTVAAVWLAATAAQDLRRTQSAIGLMRATADAERAASSIGVEIGQFPSQLRAAQPERDVLARDAGITDKRLADLEASLVAAGMDPAPVQKATADATDARRRMWASIGQPLAARDTALPATVSSIRNDLVDALLAVAGKAARRVGLDAPGFALMIEASSLVMDMRDLAGRRNTALVAWIGGAPVTMDGYRDIEMWTAQLQRSWLTAQRVLGNVPNADRLDEAVARMRTTFDRRDEPRWREVIAMGRQRLGQAPTPWPMSVPEFRAWSVPSLAELLLLRDAVLDEAMADAHDRAAEALRIFLGAGLLAVLSFVATLLGVMYLLGRIVRPLHHLTRAVTAIAAGELGTTVPEVMRRDELGEMAQAVETLRLGSIERTDLAREQSLDQGLRLERAERLDRVLRGFETETGDVLRAVAAAATELDATAASMAGIATNGSEHAASVAYSATQASGNVQTVAVATEQLSASIREVARQIGGSAEKTREATHAAMNAHGIVRGLAEAAGRIGDVVDMITSIAGQTNLLALNATIEAARAGEAGKGFAVVASEVKNLAIQTTKATEQIAGQITSMQTETERTVQAIGVISGIIEVLNQATSSVAEAADQQSLATQEIGQAVAKAADETANTSAHAQGVSVDAERTGTAAGEVRNASEELARQAEGLRGRVDRFLGEVRAA